jgi:CubicO group peptidase (beta-lactamase class C family)
VLYLDGGRWGGRQVLPAEWVAQTNVIPSDRPRPNVWDTGFHQFQWWGRKVAPPGVHDFYANGHFGQRLYVSPRSRLVLLRMGDSNEGVDWAEFLGTIADAFARRGAAAAE